MAIRFSETTGRGFEKPWLARVTGTDPKYKLAQDFLRGDRTYNKRGGVSSAEWEVSHPGVYRVGGTKYHDRFIAVWKGAGGALKSRAIRPEDAHEAAKAIAKAQAAGVDASHQSHALRAVASTQRVLASDEARKLGVQQRGHREKMAQIAAVLLTGRKSGMTPSGGDETRLERVRAAVAERSAATAKAAQASASTAQTKAGIAAFLLANQRAMQGRMGQLGIAPTNQQRITRKDVGRLKGAEHRERRFSLHSDEVSATAREHVKTGHGTAKALAKAVAQHAQTGPRGGRFILLKSGKKVYLSRSLAGRMPKTAAAK